MGYFHISGIVVPMASIYSKEYQRFLSRLKLARHQAKMTQAQVAGRLNKPQSYVSKCESGERRVDAVELSRFAKLYGRSLAFFFKSR